MRRRFALGVLAVLACRQAAPAQPLEIVTSLGPAVEAEIRDAVAAARETYAQLDLTLRKPDLPTLVIVLPTTVELSPFLGAAAGRSRAFSLAGADRNYVVVGWEAPGSPLRAAAHEYAHLVDPLPDGPAWFREGFAEYLSYLEPDGAGGFAPVAPAHHLLRLRDSEWLPLEPLLRAGRGSPELQAPTFYAQSWLTVRWLASQGSPPARLRPEAVDRALESLGPAGLESALRAALATMTPAPQERQERPWTIAAAPASPYWDVRLALAEVDRELGRRERSGAALRDLEIERPGHPATAAAFGALAMDEGRYDQAEEWLRRAAGDVHATARTRYRLALLLLRPSATAQRERASEAARQSRLALEIAPAADYRLVLAQALMVEESWEAAAAELRLLSASPGWRERAEREMAELVRRRQQAMTAESRPRVQPVPAGPPELPPIETAAVPPPPTPAPPSPMRWPPPGATILAGRIDYVDCSGPQKIIVMRHPLLNLRFREPKGRPAKLFACPLKDWTEIPCGAKGWTVNLAYYPRYASDGAVGDAVAILF